jgi:hypothetical protein
MRRSSFHDTAERLRLIGNTLTIGADRSVVETYADELEALSRYEVREPEPGPPKGVQDELQVAIIAEVLKKAFPLDADPAFDSLLVALAKSR